MYSKALGVIVFSMLTEVGEYLLNPFNFSIFEIQSRLFQLGSSSRVSLDPLIATVAI